MKKSIYKVPNGKMVKISLQETSNKITSIRITGDFFLHPESSIDELEYYLVGCEIDRDQLLNRITNFLSQEDIVAIGVNADAFVHAIMKAEE